jgi:hypothetical protein
MPHIHAEISYQNNQYHWIKITLLTKMIPAICKKEYGKELPFTSWNSIKGVNPTVAIECVYFPGTQLNAVYINENYLWAYQLKWIIVYSVTAVLNAAIFAILLILYRRIKNSVSKQSPPNSELRT